MQLFGAVRQAITWANCDPALWSHVVGEGHNEVDIDW